MLFICDRAREVWRSLGMSNMIDGILYTYRSGSVVLEEIITRGGEIPQVDNVGFKELVSWLGGIFGGSSDK